MYLGLGLDIMSDEPKKTDMISKKMYNIESKIINSVINGDNETIDFGENLSSEEMKEVSEIVELCSVYKEYIFNEIDVYKDKYNELNKWFEYEGPFESEEHNFFVKNIKKKTKIKD